MLFNLGEKHETNKVATPGFSTGETPSLGSQVLVVTNKTPGSPAQFVCVSNIRRVYPHPIIQTKKGNIDYLHHESKIMC